MGYTTDFSGRFDLNKKLTEAQAAYLREFHSTRRMSRDVKKMRGYSDPIREAVNLPLGTEGEFFVGTGDSNKANWPKSGKPSFSDCAGQLHTPDIHDYNHPPSTQPGLWCQWVPTEDLTGIEWDGSEKFYDYVGWIGYLIENFLKPWGLVLNGTVEWQGEDSDDKGRIIVNQNSVRTQKGRVVYD